MAVTATPPQAPVDRRAAALSGVVAAGVALGVGQLVSGIAGSGPTLVTAVGTQFIDRFAASLKDLAVAVFGTNDKAALVVGIVVVSLLLGAALGRAAARRLWVGVVGFVAFGLIGLYSLAKDPQGELSTAIVASLFAVVAGVATLVVLLRLAPRTAGGLAARRLGSRLDRAAGRSWSPPACWPSALSAPPCSGVASAPLTS